MAVPFIKDFDDFAESMANPNPNRPIQEAVASLGRAACDRISARPEIWAPTILQSPLVAACTPYWNAQGYDAPELVTPDFTGGQCSAEYVADVFNNGSLNQTTSPFQGPVGSVIRTGSGNPIFQLFAPNGDFIIGAGLTFGSVVSPSIVFRLTSGAPDNCGDPEPFYEPGPNPAPDPGPLPPGTGPTINARGGVIFVLPGAVQITPTLEVGLNPGEINLGSGTGNAAPVEPLPGDELAGAGSGDGGGENDFGEPPEGERWVGCCVRITDTPTGSGVIPSSIPHDIYPLTIGNARLRFQSGAAPAQYDTPIQNRAETSCLWEPVRGLKPLGAFINLLPGYGYTVTPYSIPLEQ